MRCELKMEGICLKDPLETYLLPLRQADGKLDTTACKPCGVARGAICEEHDEIAWAWRTGDMACKSCIARLYRQTLPRLGELVGRFWEMPDKNLFQIYKEWADRATATLGETPYEHVLYLILFVAMSRKIMPEEALEAIALDEKFAQYFTEKSLILDS